MILKLFLKILQMKYIKDFENVENILKDGMKKLKKILIFFDEKI